MNQTWITLIAMWLIALVVLISLLLLVSQCS